MKSAVKLRESLDKEIGSRRAQVNQEIERLKEEILGKEIKRINTLEENEIKKAKEDADDIRSAAEEKCKAMYSRFSELKEGLIQEMFNEIFSI
jgi:hypothetical protein